MTGTDQAAGNNRISKILFHVIGWASAIASLLIYPFVFGLMAVISGIHVSRNGSRAGMALIAASIILMAVGLIFNKVIFEYIMSCTG